MASPATTSTHRSPRPHVVSHSSTQPSFIDRLEPTLSPIVRRIVENHYLAALPLVALQFAASNLLHRKVIPGQGFWGNILKPLANLGGRRVLEIYNGTAYILGGAAAILALSKAYIAFMAVPRPRVQHAPEEVKDVVRYHFLVAGPLIASQNLIIGNFKIAGPLKPFGYTIDLALFVGTSILALSKYRLIKDCGKSKAEMKAQLEEQAELKSEFEQKVDFVKSGGHLGKSEE